MEITGPTSWPAAADRENEDCAVVSRKVAVVVDGAGLPASMRAGCSHGVAWYSRQVARRLSEHLADVRTDPRSALRATITDVAGTHAATCDLAAGSPSATVAAWRVRGETLEYLVLCDASVILSFKDGSVRHVTDDRLDRVLDAAVRASAPAADPLAVRRTLAGLADLLTAGRHAEALEGVRAAEREQRARLSALAMKSHDDATVVSARVPVTGSGSGSV